MTGEVGVVLLDVAGGEGDASLEAAGSYPGVVGWASTAAENGGGLDVAPGGGYVVVVGEPYEGAEPVVQVGPGPRPQWRTSVQTVSSATVTKDTQIVRPARRAARVAGSRSRKARDATSVSITTYGL